MVHGALVAAAHTDFSPSHLQLWCSDEAAHWGRE